MWVNLDSSFIGLAMMMPGSLLWVLCTPLSPKNIMKLFLFRSKDHIFLCSNFSNLPKFQKKPVTKFKMSPHQIHQWTPQSNADFHHCRQAYHIISNHTTLYVIMFYNSSKRICKVVNWISNCFKWSPHVDTPIGTIKICWKCVVKIGVEENIRVGSAPGNTFNNSW